MLERVHTLPIKNEHQLIDQYDRGVNQQVKGAKVIQEQEVAMVPE
jgi:hypothetical protein